MQFGSGVGTSLENLDQLATALQIPQLVLHQHLCIQFGAMRYFKNGCPAMHGKYETEALAQEIFAYRHEVTAT
ncbi:MAG: hypothetical protein P4M11_11945 [Candidatus Pacebacteria bacterium]|nr:hypothetical protein [Candidatus Paceibacterota bacterium]